MSPNDSMTVVEAVKKAQELADELQSEQTSLKLFRCNHLLDILLPLIAHAKSAPKEQIDIPMLKGLVADAIINYNSTKRIDGASIRDLSCFIVNYLVAAKALLTASLPTEPTFTAGEVVERFRLHKIRIVHDRHDATAPPRFETALDEKEEQFIRTILTGGK